MRNIIKNGSITLLTALFYFFLIGNIYSFFRLKQLKNSFYRSHDKHTLPNESKYKKNIDSYETNSYGDLCALGGFYKNCYFSEGERKHRFKTDNYGFKTLAALNKSDLIIIGDSFLAASGGDEMNQQLGSVLSRLSLKNIYEAAHPGEISAYIKRHQELQYENPEAKYIYLLFEGNDFEKINNFTKEVLDKQDNFKKPRNSFRSIYTCSKENPSDKSLCDIPLIKLMYVAYRAKKSLPKDISRVKVLNLPLSKRNQAFLVDYINITEVDIKIPQKEFEFLLDKKNNICGIVYVPTAYATYVSKKSFKKRHPSLNSQFNSLNKKGIQIINLTIPLQKAAAIENKIGPIWWGDDTHWNSKGIELSARAISRNLNCINKDL